MKNNKGFTLVELLSVIIILAAVGLIIFPIINKTAEKSREKTLIESANGLVRAGELYRAENGNKFDGPYEITEGTIKLDKSEKWESGYIYEIGNKILIAAYDGEHCIVGTSKDYQITKGECNYESISMSCEYVAGQVFDFDYKGSVQEFNATCPGKYKLEVWGAEGGDSYWNCCGPSGKIESPAPGGRGGYTTGIVDLSDLNVMNIHVGGRGGDRTFTNSNVDSGYNSSGGFNGGGASTMYPAGGGGGACDIRISGDTLYNRIIVAGGGGGGGNPGRSSLTALIPSGRGGHGGGLIGEQPPLNEQYDGRESGVGGSQVAGYGFGIGSPSSDDNHRGGAGGGWYGGKVGENSTGAGGGSGWVYTENAYNIWATAVGAAESAKWKLNPKYYLTNANTYKVGDLGFKANPKTDGHGFARITYLG